jgi:hypothetical protein
MTELLIVACFLFVVAIVREWQIAQSEKRWAEERAELIQRIQAPEQAVVDHSIGTTPITLAVPFDDDEEAIEAKQIAEKAAKELNGPRGY